MLDAFIIEEIKRREEERREEFERNRPRIPIPDDAPPPVQHDGEDDGPGSRVIIIDYSV